MRTRYLAALVLIAACGSAGQPLEPVGNPAVRLTILPSIISVQPGSKVSLDLIGHDAAGAPLDVVPGVRWSSSAPQVATVNSIGEVTGVAAGTTTITAEAGTLTASATVNVVPVTPADLRFFPAAPSLVPGSEVYLYATPVSLDGAMIRPIPAVSWTNSDSLVASIGAVNPTGNNIVVRAHRSGTTTLTATTMGITKQVVVTVAAELQPGGGFSVVDFHMIEFQYDSWPGRWFYAPQLRVAETSGLGSIDVLRMEISMPGYPQLSPICAGYRLPPGTVRDLFVETYGDFQLTFDASVRATGAPATAVIYYRDGSDELRHLTVSGPVVPGTVPTTYTGGPAGIWASCSGR